MATRIQLSTMLACFGSKNREEKQVSKLQYANMGTKLALSIAFATLLVSTNGCHSQQQQRQNASFATSSSELKPFSLLFFDSASQRQQQQQQHGTELIQNGKPFIEQAWRDEPTSFGALTKMQARNVSHEISASRQHSKIIHKRQSNDQLDDDTAKSSERRQTVVMARDKLRRVSPSLSSSLWQRHASSSNNNGTMAIDTYQHQQLRRSPDIMAPVAGTPGADVCSDRLCYGLPMGCLDRATSTAQQQQQSPRCSVLVTSKYLIDPYKPIARDIHFELVALPVAGQSNYAAVGFSSTGRMAGLVSECLQYRDSNTKLQIITLAHSYNIPGAYSNVPVTILSGIKNLGVSYENGYYQCRWIVESAVEFTYEDANGQVINKREDLGYKNYHILLASGAYNERTNIKSIHSDRVSSMAPISLAQTGQIKSLGSHVLIRIHGSLMIAIWIGLVTISIILARYYKNEWSNSKINDTAIWFVFHRTLMLTAWFGSIIAVIFAYMYTETYHPGIHQISGTTCLLLSTVQVFGGLLRPSLESAKRVYFNWTHFLCGNIGYLCAMISIVTSAFLPPAHLPPIYIWVVVAFVAVYALTHILMTIHQYIVHKSSKISITPMNDLDDTNPSSTYSSCGFVADSCHKEVNSTFRQIMLGTLVTIIVIFIILLISLVNIK